MTLGRALAGAAGVEGVTDAVAEAHRRRGAHAAGWPPTRWISRLKPDPLRRLGLDRRPHRVGRRGRGRPRRRGRPDVPAAALAGGDGRRVDGDQAGGRRRVGRISPDPWRHRLGTVANARRGDLDDALDRAVGTVRLPTDRPRWWRVAGAVQWLLAAALAVGLLWLLAIFVVAWFQLPDLPSVDIGELPLPTVLAIGGAALGLLVAAITAGRPRSGPADGPRSPAAGCVAAATDVGRDLVIAPLDAELPR